MYVGLIKDSELLLWDIFDTRNLEIFKQRLTI